MLRLLSAQDFAIVERAELPLAHGMTALTGETGAGKSLMVDALLLLAGARGDSSAIRHGAERAELAAEFDLSASPATVAWLRALEIDDGDECRVRRVLRADGTSRAFINDRAVSVATLRDLGAQLIEIHGQHEHQALLTRGRQLHVLDGYGDLDALRAPVAAAAKAWQSLDKQLQALAGKAGIDGQALEFLRFQLDELAKHAVAPEALVELEAEHRRLAHRGELIEGAERAHEALDGDHDGAVRPLIARLAGEIERLAATDPGLAGAATCLKDAAVQIDEAADALDRYRSTTESDPSRLQALDAQLGRLHDLARKHRVAPGELKAREETLRTEYDDVANAEARLASLTAERDAARARWKDAAAALTQARRKAATKLGKSVSALMGELGMAGGAFSIAIETDVEATPSPDGADAVEFMVAANPGQPAKPLRRVASGGELSRISLAIEVATLGRGDVPTMVFDEVDSGIGGAVAEVVGRKLRELGANRQVLCVTHLPQVAAQAHRQFAVSKAVAGGRTKTQWLALDDASRVEEIARMLGGVEITKETRSHAREMLSRVGGGK